jgi:anti-sigma B factor antagonist
MEVRSRYYETTFEVRSELLSPAFLAVIAGQGRFKLVGELDMASAPGLRALLSGAEGDIEIDCSGLTFIDCAGLRVLEAAQHACQVAGIRMSLTAPPQCVTRWLALAGLDGIFDVPDGSGS